MILAAPNSVSELTNYDFVRCRNHMLYSQLEMFTALQWWQFSIKDYQDGIKQTTDDEENIVFSIAEHKTVSSHGAATLAVNRHKVELLAGYVRLQMLPQFDNSEPFIFITTTTTEMTQSNVSSALTAAFGNSGYADRVNCTKLRKAAVTKVHRWEA